MDFVAARAGALGNGLMGQGHPASGQWEGNSDHELHCPLAAGFMTFSPGRV